MNPRLARTFDRVLRHPRDDEPRLQVAAEIRGHDPLRARFIEQDVEEARLHAESIVRRSEPPDRLADLRRDNAKLLETHGSRWQRDEGSIGGRWTRGFLGGVQLTATPTESSVAALDEWPILHVSAHGAPMSMPEPVQRAIPRLVSIQLHEHDDPMVDRFLRTYDLSTLRLLSVLGTITENSLHAICQAHLPMLEDLHIEAPRLENPCETGESSDWPGYISWARRSKLGEALEAKYGWKKYFHAASRFSIWPYPLEVLEVLPPLPDDLQDRPRRWHL